MQSSDNFYYEESEIAGTFFLRQRVRARVCSLCEVISHAETLKGHLDFFIRAFSRLAHAPHDQMAQKDQSGFTAIFRCFSLPPLNAPKLVLSFIANIHPNVAIFEKTSS